MNYHKSYRTHMTYAWLALLVLLLAGRVSAVPKAIIDLGSPDVATLMTHVQVSDGDTTPATIGGLTCRQNATTTDGYFYFGIADSFAYQGSRPTMYITIHYYDTGTATLTLNYDSISDPYRSGGTVTLANTNVWKSKGFRVTDGYFGNRENGGADFRIAVSGNTTFYLDMVYARDFCGPNPSVRFVPPPGRPAMDGAPFRAMMENTSQWPVSWGQMSVLAYYGWAFGNYSDAELSGWLQQIVSSGKKLGIETGAVKPGAPTGEQCYNNDNGTWTRINSLGGSVDALIMDEPLTAVRGEGLGDDNYAVNETTDWMQLVRQNFPGVQIGSIEAHPYISLSSLQWWITALQNSCAARGIEGIDYFVLDADWRQFPGNSNWNNVKTLETYCHTNGLPFSLIYWPSPHSSSMNDVDFWTDINNEGAAYAAVGGAPDEYDVQCWDYIPLTVIPETTNYTFTNGALRFVNQYVPRAQAAYSGVISLPGTVQAENFDNGGETVSYHDTTLGNTGAAYRVDNSVDIENSSGGICNVGWIGAGEWLEYAVSVASTSTYDIQLRVATPNNGCTFHIEMNGTNVTGTQTIPNTTDWHTWATKTVSGISLTAGQQVLRLSLDAGSSNVDYIYVKAAGAPLDPVTSFTATTDLSQNTVSWRNSSDASFAGTMVRYKTSGYPTSVSDGTLLCDRLANPGTSDSYVHTGVVRSKTYFYSAFAHTSAPVYATKVNASVFLPPMPVTGLTVTPGLNQNALSWTNPNMSAFVGTMVRFSTNGFPATTADGSLVCNRPAAPGSADNYAHTGISNGTTYYYSAFAYDNVPNYAVPAQATGRPLGPRENISNSVFTLNLDGWTASTWKADPGGSGALIAYSGAAGRTGGGVRCNGGGITDDEQRCLREGGEIQKTISTVGYEKIGVSYDLRVNTLGGNYTGAGTGGCTVDHNLIDEQLTVFYSTNGTDWIEAEYITRDTLLTYQTYGTRTLDLSSVIACDENPNFTLRFRWQLNRDLDAADLDNTIISGNATGPPDTTPPGQLQTFTATRGNGQVSLGWRNPTTNDFIGTMIRFKTTGYPANSADGTLVCDRTKTPDSFDNYTHTGLTNGALYYYSAFCYDEAPNYSTATQASATPADTTAPSNASNFTATVGNTRNTLAWTNPSTSDFTGTMIRFKTSGYPSNATDGTLVIDKANTPSSTDSCIHSDLTNGVTYYYKAFAHDAAPNYASGVTITAVPVYFDAKDAKLAANNTVLTLTAGAISAAFTDFFYVQNPDNETPVLGIRVSKAGHGLPEGYLVGVKGTALTDDTTGEKYLSATWAATSVTAAVSAKSMANTAVGGVDWNYDDLTKAGQRGIAGATGPNNIGLLVRVWGKITQRQPAGLNKYFYLNDGSNVTDGTDTGGAANQGVRISADPAGHETDEYVAVTGIVSCFKDGGGNVRRLILPKMIQEL